MNQKHYTTTALLLTAFFTLPCVAADCNQAEADFVNAQSASSAAEQLLLLERSIIACPTFAAWYTKGRILLDTNNPKEALTAFKEAHKLADGRRFEGFALGRMAQAYLALTDIPAAMGTIESAVKMLGNDTPDWLQTIRHTVDLQLTQNIMSAQTITKVLGTARSFGVEPRINIRIHFAFDSAALDDEGIAQARELGKALLNFSNDGYTMTVVGHTDQQGSAAYNQKLSEARALSVTRYLAHEFAALAGQLRALGKGETDLLYTDDNEQAHQLNRRVEIKLVSP